MGNEEVEKEDCGRRTDIKLEKGSAEALLPEEVTELFTDVLHNGSKNLACNHQDTHRKGWGQYFRTQHFQIFSFHCTILYIFVLVLNKHKIPIKYIYNET